MFLSLNCIVDETFLVIFIINMQPYPEANGCEASKLLKLTINSGAHSTTWKLNSILIRLDIDDCTFCYAGERRVWNERCVSETMSALLFSGVRGEETPYLDILKITANYIVISEVAQRLI